MGGHEVQTVFAAMHLASAPGHSVGFMCSKTNRRLLDRLEDVRRCGGTIAIIPHDSSSRSFQGIRTPFERGQIGTLASVIDRFAPDIVLVAQGTIEISTLGVIASKRLGAPTVSYLPFAHTLHSMSVPLGVFRDVMNRYYYRRPDAFITSSAMASECIARWGVPGDRIYVVENSIAVDQIPFTPARARTGRRYTFGLIGRIAMRQKGHDVLLRAVARHADILGDIKIVIIGDGPDRDRLARMIERMHGSDKVSMQPWKPRIVDAFEEIDALLIPSRYEGVPVVMQEAMAYGLPIAGSEIAGIAEYLPKAWLFPSGSEKAMIEALGRVRAMENGELLEKNRDFVVRECSPKTFGERFERVLVRYARNP